MPSFFKTKKLKTETLGEYLRDTRTSLKLDYPQVQRLTQIPEKYLKALEEGNFNILPADIYVRGFLKSLAAVYKISAEALLEQFGRERGLDRSLKTDPLAPSVSKKLGISRFVVTPKTFTIVLVAFAGLFSLGYLVWQVRSVSAPPPLFIQFPEADVVISARSVLLRGVTEDGARVYINGEEIPIGASGEFREVLSLAEGSNKILIKATNRFGKTTEAERTIVVNAPPAETPTSTSTQLDNKIAVTVLVGPENAWINVTADGKVLQDGIMTAGQKLVFSADKELMLTTGNAGSTRVWYNGRDLGSLGKPGEVLSNIKFTP